MLQIIKERQTIYTTHRRRDFYWEKDKDAGFTFEIDEKDQPVFQCEAAKNNYEWAITSPTSPTGGKLIDNGIIEFTTSCVEPAIGKCVCGGEVKLTGGYYGAVQCDCGNWYNPFGQELLPPEEWEEDL